MTHAESKVFTNVFEEDKNLDKDNKIIIVHRERFPSHDRASILSLSLCRVSFLITRTVHIAFPYTVCLIKCTVHILFY